MKSRIVTKAARYKVRSYIRRTRPPSKKRIILREPVRLYPLTDEYGQRLGWSAKPPRKRKG